MKVKELKNFLEKCNPEAEIYLELDGDLDNCNNVYGAIEVLSSTHCESGVYIQAEC